MVSKHRKKFKSYLKKHFCQIFDIRGHLPLHLPQSGTGSPLRSGKARLYPSPSRSLRQSEEALWRSKGTKLKYYTENIFERNYTLLPLVLLNLLLSFAFVQGLNAQTDLKLYEKNRTFTWDELIAAWDELDKNYSEVQMTEAGKSDNGKPLHLVYITESGNYETEMRHKAKVRLLINNGIHPGEPDGIDASINFVSDLLKKNRQLLKTVSIVIVPVYNVDGALNRSCCSRANQNGPEEYGFRGNAKNLDLNRDFIKVDSKNAKTFAGFFTAIRPHVFIDTHVSNGADYQYTLTLITTQLDKLGGPVAELCKKDMEPWLYARLQKKGFPMIPYVNTLDETPESGIADFNESPRFATGYTALFNTIGFTTETHMFKPYKDRVLATYNFINEVAGYCSDHSKEIIAAKSKADSLASTWYENKKQALNFDTDTTRFKWIEFKGYEAEYKVSELTGQKQLTYNRNKPWSKNIKYYNRFVAKDTVVIPFVYIVPQAWDEVIERLELNHVTLHEFIKDTVIECTAYYIRDYSTGKFPYEGHYLHSSVKTETVVQKIQFYTGDKIIYLNQPCNRFLMEVLEPAGVDSYFNWNFFDAVLQQKEWFSSYVFEEKAKELLSEDAELKKQLEEKKKNDPSFAEDAFAQLLFVYRNSAYYEKSHNRYPVYRLEKKVTLPVKAAPGSRK